MVELRFKRPVRPVSVNETASLHWAARKRKLDPWDAAVREAWETVDGSAIVGSPARVHVTLAFPEHRRRDPHNYTGTVVKKIVDTLVRLGVWPDDTPDYVYVDEPTLVVGDECVVRLTPIARSVS